MKPSSPTTPTSSSLSAYWSASLVLLHAKRPDSDSGYRMLGTNTLTSMTAMPRKIVARRAISSPVRFVVHLWFPNFVLTKKTMILAGEDRFPSGMRNLTDQVHAMGLWVNDPRDFHWYTVTWRLFRNSKAGIYSDSGWFTCQLFPGSFQNEDRFVILSLSLMPRRNLSHRASSVDHCRDIELFQETWGFDLLKYVFPLVFFLYPQKLRVPDIRLGHD